MMKKITGIVLCLALVLSMGCAFAAPEEEKVLTYAVDSSDVQLAFHLFETFTWYIPDGEDDMSQYDRCPMGTNTADGSTTNAKFGAKDVFVGNGVLNMYVSSDNGFKLVYVGDIEAYKTLSLKYNLYKSTSESATAINAGTAKNYDDAKLYKVLSMKTNEEKSETLYYQIQELSKFNGCAYQDYLTFYALVESDN